LVSPSKNFSIPSFAMNRLFFPYHLPAEHQNLAMNQQAPPTLQPVLFQNPTEAFLHYQKRQFQYKMQMLYYAQNFQQNLTQNNILMDPPKIEESYSTGASEYYDIDTVKTEASSCKIEANEPLFEFFPKKEEAKDSCQMLTLKGQIVNMLKFALKEFGKGNSERIQAQRNVYLSNPILLNLFDNLIDKYSSAAKCREDMVRFVLRKAISSLRDSLRAKQNITSKAASIALCKKYFKADTFEQTKKEFGVDDEEDLLNFRLPYKKNSRNKTANSKFMTEIFSSAAFYKDYLEYLNNFENILQHDNKKKFDKFVEFLEDCVNRNAVHEVKKYKRLPWLDQWLETTQVIAHELLDLNTWKNTNKPELAKFIKTELSCRTKSEESDH